MIEKLWERYDLCCDIALAALDMAYQDVYEIYKQLAQDCLAQIDNILKGGEAK